MFQLPPEITLPLEQLTIFIIEGIISYAGVFPTADMTKLKERVASAFETNLTLLISYILASLPTIEYDENPQYYLLKV